MPFPVIIANNQTISDIYLERIGEDVPGSGSLNLTEIAVEYEIKADESLFNSVVAGDITLDFGQGDVGTGESIKFFNITTQETRQPVRALSDTNIASLSGTTTVDGVSLVADDRVLLTGQTDETENGIWVVKAGAWERATDMDTGQSPVGAIIGVIEGNVYTGQVWFCDSTSGTIVGTDNITFKSPANNRRVRLEKMFNDAFDNAYTEFTYTGDNLTKIEIWDTAGKVSKLFTRDLSYTGDNLTSVTTTDEQSTEVLSTTFSYTGDNITNITKTIT